MTGEHELDRDDYCPECDVYLTQCDFCGRVVHEHEWGGTTTEGDSACTDCWAAVVALRASTGMEPNAAEHYREYVKWVAGQN